MLASAQDLRYNNQCCDKESYDVRGCYRNLIGFLTERCLVHETDDKITVQLLS